MTKRTTIVSAAVIALVIILAIASQAVTRKELTLYANTDITSIRVNDISLAFHSGMRIAYNKPITLNASKDGYEFYSKTLDPAHDNVQSFTMTLTKQQAAGQQGTPSAKPDTATDLSQAAQTAPSDTGLLSLGQLNVEVVSSRTFSDGYVVDTVRPPDSAADGGTALVVLQKQAGGNRIVLGPGTNFSSDSLGSVPNDVGNYLKSIGAVGE